jgi:hypothetical protein
MGEPSVFPLTAIDNKLPTKQKRRRDLSRRRNPSDWPLAYFEAVNAFASGDACLVKFTVRSKFFTDFPSTSTHPRMPILERFVECKG